MYMYGNVGVWGFMYSLQSDIHLYVRGVLCLLLNSYRN